MHQGKGNVVASANDTVTHALLLANLLELSGGCASSINRTRLCVPDGFSDHRKALGVSAEVDATALKEVDVAVRIGSGLCNNILVIEEGPGTDGVFTVTAVICFLKRCGQTLEGCHARLAEGCGRNHEGACSVPCGFGSSIHGGRAVSENNDIPCFHLESPQGWRSGGLP
jgi:hypothetical protein